MNAADRWLTIAEAARYLGYRSPQAARALIARSARTDGRRGQRGGYLLRRASLDAWVQRRGRPSRQRQGAQHEVTEGDDMPTKIHCGSKHLRRGVRRLPDERWRIRDYATDTRAGRAREAQRTLPAEWSEATVLAEVEQLKAGLAKGRAPASVTRAKLKHCAAQPGGVEFAEVFSTASDSSTSGSCSAGCSTTACRGAKPTVSSGMQNEP